MTEIETLKKQLAEAIAKNDRLQVQLDNVTLLYKLLLIKTGKLPTLSRENGNPISN